MPSLAVSLVSAVLFIGLGLVVGVKLVSPLLGRLDCTPLARQYPEFVFIAALAFAFAYAMVAEAIGLSAIVGAFIAGVSCRDVTLCHSRDPREGAEYLQVIFAAIFFVSLGIIVDLRALTPAVAVLVGAITVVAILTKLVGRPAGPAIRAPGAGSGRHRVRDGAARRSGYDCGADRVERRGDRPGDFAAILLMSLVTTVVTPVVFQNWLLRGDPPEMAETVPEPR